MTSQDPVASYTAFFATNCTFHQPPCLYVEEKVPELAHLSRDTKQDIILIGSIMPSGPELLLLRQVMHSMLFRLPALLNELGNFRSG